MIAIFPGRFWAGVAIRFGLFTCLLRACCKVIESDNYKSMSWKDSLENWIAKSINVDQYLSDTRNSVLNFMGGNTFVTGLLSADWHLHMKGLSSPSLVNPLKFSHNEYIGHVRRYAHTAWETLGRISGKDSEIWAAAERYAATNSCR